MSVPTTRVEFKDYCLRALGHDVIEINVSEEQVQDRIDEALYKFQSQHFDAIENVYLSHQLTAGDVSNNYVVLDSSIKGVTGVFNVAGIGTNYGEPLSLAFQLRAGDILWGAGTSLMSFTMLDWYLFKRHMTLIEELLNGATQIRFNRVTHKLYLDGDWDNVLTAGKWIVVNAVKTVDPDTFTGIWNTHWLQQYCIALIQRQWARNLSKYDEVRLPGGIILNGEKLYQRATVDLEELEHELDLKYSMPPHMQVG